MFWRSLLMIFFAVFALAGCSGSGGAASVERRERNSSLYRAAISAEQSGDLDQAVELYSKLLYEDPKAVSAHFQLALLLQDHKRDYLGAIHHYRTYLRLRPESDKSGNGEADRETLIVQRIARAKAQLAPQLLEELGDSVDSVSQAKLMKTNGELEDRLRDAATAQQRITRERDEALEKVKTLEGETARLRKLVEDLRGADVVAAEPSGQREKLKAEKVEPAQDLDAKRALLDKFRRDAENESSASKKGESLREVAKKESDPEKQTVESDAARIIREALADGTLTPEQVKPDTGNAKAEQAKPTVKREDTKEALNALLGRGKGAKNEKHPETKAVNKFYVVQPGDTLFRVAEKFYGDSAQWKRIRDANRTRIDPDGRIRAGQRILIP